MLLWFLTALAHAGLITRDVDLDAETVELPSTGFEIVFLFDPISVFAGDTFIVNIDVGGGNIHVVDTGESR